MNGPFQRFARGGPARTMLSMTQSLAMTDRPAQATASTGNATAEVVDLAGLVASTL
jgi:hypothetical protein